MHLNTKRTAVWLLLALLTLSSAWAGEPPKCRVEPLVLWGDGEHDDAAALNAWFRGESVVWAHTYEPVGSEIAGRTFLLGDALYVPSGTDRKLEQFRMVWPHRRETVSGGTIVTSNNPDEPPVAQGIVKVGSDSNEGVPFEAPTPPPTDRQISAGCLTS